MTVIHYEIFDMTEASTTKYSTQLKMSNQYIWNVPMQKVAIINAGYDQRISCIICRFGRGVSLYHYRSQLFVRFVGTIPTADRAVF